MLRTGSLMMYIVWVASLALPALQAAAPGVYEFDLRGPAHGISASTLQMGSARSKSGDTLGVNSYYFLRNGKPWFPVMGEMHYSRYPRQYWEEAIQKMKAGGIEVVATYVFWNHHEPVEGQWNWSDNRALREYLQLCAKHGLYAFVRLGPWSHGEARNGGHPDWLLAKKGIRLRSTDPKYLAYTKELYEQIWAQCRGLLFKDGGPIIGIQVDNEMTGNPEYLHALKQLAIEIGFDTPFYTATAWMNAQLPGSEFLPVWAAYADMPWDDFGRNPVPPRKQYLFTSGMDLFDQRTQDAPGAGLDLDKLRADHLLDKAVWLPQNWPFAMAELGGGIQVVRKRRPVLSAKDVAALALTAAGKGANMLGYYMYQGGSQPAGLEEPGLPPVSYDFQAPLGEFGYSRESYRYLRALHFFVQDFAAELAPAFPVLPAQMPSDPKDNSHLRSIVRSSGGSGFIFWSNYHRGVAMKDLGEVQFSVTMESGKIFVPAKPLTILRDTFGVWPFRLSLGGAMLRYATVEPLSVIRSAGQPPTYFFFASEGVAPEYVFDGNPQIETRCGKPEHQGDATRVAELTPGTGCLMTVRGTGEAVRVVTLSNAQSRLYWKARVAGTEYAFLSAADLQFDSAGIVADSIDAPQIGLAVYPSMAVESSPAARESKDGVFTNYQVSLTAKRVSVESHADGTGRWSLKFPGDAMQGLSDVILSAKWTGNTAQLYPSGTHELIADDFYTGQTWQIGLKRFAPGIFETGATLEVSPLEKNANIFLERWPSIAGDAIQELQSVQALPVYRVRFRVGAK